MDENEIEPRRGGWRGWRLALAAIALLLVAALLGVWLLRVRLAADYIDSEFARRGVTATYQIKRIGFGSQILENLVIGDPARPDATARRVEVQLLFGLTGPQVGLIRARGVRLYGRLRHGRLTFGQIDRLLPPPSGLPFRLPDQRVDVADAAVAISTPAGPVALGLAGRGNLADGFRGELALASPGLSLGECAIARPRGLFRVAVDSLRPRLRGPVALPSVRCEGALSVDRGRVVLDATLSPAIDHWRGQSVLRADRVASGSERLDAVGGRLSFDGNADRTIGRLDVASGSAALGPFQAARTRFAGAYAVSPRRGDAGFEGDASASALRLQRGALAGITASLRSAAGTPVGPIGDALAAALVRASESGAAATARLRVANRGGTGAVELGRIRLAAASGAELQGVGGAGVNYLWPSGGLRLDGDFALSGGGFPDARFALRQARPGGAIEGRGRIAPMQAGGARLALGALRFTASPGGETRFATTLLADGPIGSGRVEGLSLPLTGRIGRGGLRLGEGCVTASFRAFRVETLRLGPGRLPLCPVGPALVWQTPGGVLYGADVGNPRFSGRLGGSPIALAAARLRAGRDGLTATRVAARLGPAGAASRLDIASLSGRFASGGAAGTFAGLEGKLANVPLLISEGQGRWQVLRGDLRLEGRMQVADAAAPPRFHPLESEAFNLTLADNRIRATAPLEHPATGTRVLVATVDHNLATGAGGATLDVAGLTFTPDFQPEALTRLTLGVVALVDGTVTGRGRIEWDSAGSRSTGTFSTAGMDLAAPFGPIEGLDTTIEFTDLLGLVSAPGQVARMRLVRPGIDVYDGELRYQLRANSHVALEGGRWPLAGGELFLEPTLLDFSRPTTKFITFRVVGLDAARFIQQLQFSNIAATGTFDGLIPMRFDQRGAHIVGGQLAARPEGGTLSYVGVLTDEDLGPYGILAFNALKSLRYSRFDLTLDGALDGEFVTNIDLDGIARDPVLTTAPSGGGITGMIAGRVFRQVARIPFEFNIRIQGRFRALIATARSFNDPTPLIQSVLPEFLRNRSTAVGEAAPPTPSPDPPVQDEESEPQP